ncbi:MAG: radical SAM protein, partial [Clostridiales bacterium]
MDRDINKILELTKEIRIPLSVTFELTYNCNFNCVYCYQTPSKNRIQELSFFKITKILDVLKKNGCIYLKFTGGEPLIRKDFEEIYNYAYDRNFKISISSNGSLIDENYLNLLRKNKPELINISLYGATNKTYYNFTNTKNSWTITKNNILNLIKSNIKV